MFFLVFLLRLGKLCDKKKLPFRLWSLQLSNNTLKKKTVTAATASDVKEHKACHQRHYNLCDPSSGQALPRDERPLRGMDLAGSKVAGLGKSYSASEQTAGGTSCF